MQKFCNNTHLWPDMRARVTGVSECTPPFTQDLQNSNYAFFVVSVPNSTFVDWFERVWRQCPDNAQWEMVLALNPGYGTSGLGEILGRLYDLQSVASSRLRMRLLTPGKLDDAEPRLSIVILQTEGKPMSVSVGSSHSLGLGVRHAGDVNLWVALDPAQANAMRQLAKAYWATAAELTKMRCDVPLLRSCKGDEEGYIHWQAYEAQLNDAHTPLGSDGPSIADLPLNEDGFLDEEAIAETDIEPTALDEYVPKIPPIVADIQDLYQRGSLVSVSQGVKPLAVPIPPSFFGQHREDQVGAIKHTQKFDVQLFADDATAKAIEKTRKATTDIVKLFSYSFGTGKYWVPDCAKEALDKAIDALVVESETILGRALGSTLEEFLVSRREAIKADCEKIYHRYYPQGAMPHSVVDQVMLKLKQRAVAAEEKGFTPKLTSTAIGFRYSADAREDPWTDVQILLAGIIKCPRKMLVDNFEPRKLKQANIGVMDYLVAMDVMNDDLLKTVKDEGFDSVLVKDRAWKELEFLDSVIEGDQPGSDKCQSMLDILSGSMQVTVSGSTSRGIAWK